MPKKKKTYLAHGVEKTQYEAQYDECVKKLLSDRQVLARIAKYRTEEFKDYEISEIMECIEGEPEISEIPVYPGKRKPEAITGMNTESKQPNEGEVTFDVRFYMVTKEQEHIKIILNIEAQKEYYVQYHFEPRAVFYAERMISEQIDREFTTDNYDDLKKVYSIWIFFEAPQKESDTITEYGFMKKDVYGTPVEGGKYDYISISFIRLTHGNMKESKNQLIAMLSTLFSDEMDAEEKKKILETQHHMEMTRELEGEIGSMCNVSLGVSERAYNRGERQGFDRGLRQGINQGIHLKLRTLIAKKLEKGKSVEEIAEDLEEDITVIQKLIEEIEKE